MPILACRASGVRDMVQETSRRAPVSGGWFNQVVTDDIGLQGRACLELSGHISLCQKGQVRLG